MCSLRVVKAPPRRSPRRLVGKKEPAGARRAAALVRSARDSPAGRVLMAFGALCLGAAICAVEGVQGRISGVVVWMKEEVCAVESVDQFGRKFLMYILD